jgi:chaperone required for assembly of F1-ATPase
MSMREDLFKDLLPVHGEDIDPVEMARRDLKKSLPKRFYAKAHFDLRDGAHALLLDGRHLQRFHIKATVVVEGRHLANA